MASPFGENRMTQQVVFHSALDLGIGHPGLLPISWSEIQKPAPLFFITTKSIMNSRHGDVQPLGDLWVKKLNFVNVGP